MQDPSKQVAVKPFAKKNVQRVALDIFAGDVIQLKDGVVTGRLCHVLSMAVFLKVLLFQADFLHSLFQGAAFPILSITLMTWIMRIPMWKA